MIDDLDLQRYNSLGLIPGPTESEPEYLARIQYCLQLKQYFAKEISFFDAPPYEGSILNPKNLYDISPDWVPLFFSNLKLWPWHAGAAWIFQVTATSPLGALMQLRKSLYKNKTYLKVYHLDEIIAHEFCHVGRMAFEEKQYEEFLAYRTSDRYFSRKWGPILQSALESKIFVLILATLFVLDVWLLFFGSFDLYLQMQYLKLIPFILVGTAVFRLLKRHQTLEQTEKKLKGIWENSNAVLFRLTDKEINQFALQTPDQIRRYAEGENSLRWHAIKTSYKMRPSS